MRAFVIIIMVVATTPVLVWANADDLIVASILRDLTLNEVVGKGSAAFSPKTSAILTDEMMATYGVAIKTVGELQLLTRADLGRLPSFGPKQLDEIVRKLARVQAKLPAQVRFSQDVKTRILAHRPRSGSPRDPLVGLRAVRRKQLAMTSPSEVRSESTLVTEASAMLPSGVATRLTEKLSRAYSLRQVTLDDVATLNEKELYALLDKDQVRVDAVIKALRARNLEPGSVGLPGLGIRNRITFLRLGMQTPVDLARTRVPTESLVLSSDESRWLNELTYQVNLALGANQGIDADFAHRMVRPTWFNRERARIARASLERELRAAVVAKSQEHRKASKPERLAEHAQRRLKRLRDITKARQEEQNASNVERPKKVVPTPIAKPVRRQQPAQPLKPTRRERADARLRSLEELTRKESEERAEAGRLQSFRDSLAAGPSHLVTEDSGFLPKGVAAHLLLKRTAGVLAERLTLAELSLMTEVELRSYFLDRPELAAGAIRTMKSVGLPFGSGGLLGLSIRHRILASRAGFRNPADLAGRDIRAAALPLKPTERRWLEALGAKVAIAIQAGRPVDTDFALREVETTPNDTMALRQAYGEFRQRREIEWAAGRETRARDWKSSNTFSPAIKTVNQRLLADISFSMNLSARQILTEYMYDIHGVWLRSLEELTAVTIAELALIPELEWADLRHIEAKLAAHGRRLQSAGLPGLTLRNRIAAFRSGVKDVTDLRDDPDRISFLELSLDERVWLDKAKRLALAGPSETAGELYPPLLFDAEQTAADYQICSSVLESAHLERARAAKPGVSSGVVVWPTAPRQHLLD